MAHASASYTSQASCSWAEDDGNNADDAHDEGEKGDEGEKCDEDKRPGSGSAMHFKSGPFSVLMARPTEGVSLSASMALHQARPGGPSRRRRALVRAPSCSMRT